MRSVSSIASSEPQILTINDNCNEPTLSYGFGRQLQIVPSSLNDLRLPPNPFNILATMAVVNHTEDANEDIYSSQKPEPSEPSPTSTPPRNASTFDSWKTSHTTTDDNTFYSGFVSILKLAVWSQFQTWWFCPILEWAVLSRVLYSVSYLHLFTPALKYLTKFKPSAELPQLPRIVGPS